VPLTFGAPLTALLMLLRLRRIAGCAALFTTISLIVMAPGLWGSSPWSRSYACAHRSAAGS
jgi:hypothetical protein